MSESLFRDCPEQVVIRPEFVRVHFTRLVPSIHLAWYRPFEGEKRLTTLCGQTRLVTMDDSPDRLCATCERLSGNDQGERMSLSDALREDPGNPWLRALCTCGFPLNDPCHLECEGG